MLSSRPGAAGSRVAMNTATPTAKTCCQAYWTMLITTATGCSRRSDGGFTDLDQPVPQRQCILMGQSFQLDGVELGAGSVHRDSAEAVAPLDGPLADIGVLDPAEWNPGLGAPPRSPPQF